MLARMLKVAGLYMGPNSDFVPASPDNPGGYWENQEFVRLNDDLLGWLGGGWDRPPDGPVGWWRDAPSAIRERALMLVGTFDRRGQWGWKDPRTSLTLPFWLPIVPGLKVLVAVRNPIEVAQSLKRRGGFSYALSLSLWLAYYRRILDALGSRERFVVHYDALLSEPPVRLAEILAFAGMPSTPEWITKGSAAADPGRRHHRFSAEELAEARVSDEILDLYAALSEEGGWAEDGLGASRGRPGTGAEPDEGFGPGLVDENAVELQLARRELVVLASGLDYRESLIDTLQEDLATARAELARADRLRGQAEELVCQQSRRADAQERRLEGLAGQIGRLAARFAGPPEVRPVPTAPPDDTSRNNPDEGHQEAEIADGAQPEDRSDERNYERMVAQVRTLLAECVPPDACLAVVARGDDQFLHMAGRSALHLPCDMSGAYSGYHPASDLAAIAQLEVARHRGAGFLVVPEASRWWLEHYRSFACHLRAWASVVADSDAAVVFDLADDRHAFSGSSELRRFAEGFELSHGRPPAVLDWGTGAELAAMAPRASVFTTAVAGALLPFVDRSIDVVAIPANNRDRLAEARRVASEAVVQFDGRRVTTLECRKEPARHLPSASLVVAPGDCGPNLASALDRLLATAGADLVAEVLILPDGAGGPEQAEALARGRTGDVPVHVVRSDSSDGPVTALNTAGLMAAGEFVVFVDAGAVPMPAWLPELLLTFQDHPEAGGAGALVLRA
ncbi:MAG: glycosyltransferase, partial [Acidimicrobiia bacterium]